MKAYTRALLIAASAALVSAKSINNQAVQSHLLSEAVTLASGQYTITAADGSPMVYNRALGQAYAPGSGSPSAVTLEKLDASTMSIGMGNSKCISAQWNYTINADWAGVLYACTVGSSSGNTGLRPAKQQWVLVPADGTSGASVATAATAVKAVVGGAVANLSNAGLAAAAKTTGLSKAQTSVKTSSKTSAIPKPKTHVCKSHKCVARRRRGNHHRQHHHHRRDVELQKRGAGQYYIIAFDHLSDMTTRALTNSVALSGDGLNVPSWTLSEWQEGDKSQIFTISPA